MEPGMSERSARPNGARAPRTASPFTRRGPKLQPPACYEVRFLSEADAARAAEEMDGSEFNGRKIQVTLNVVSEPITKVNVQGIPGETFPTDVRSHFEQNGYRVAFCGTQVDILFGEVRFMKADYAWKAKVELDGSELCGKKLRVELDCSTDRLNKVLVHGLSTAVQWQELKDHFKQAGEVRSAVVHGGLTARIIYHDTDGAVRAMKNLNKSRLRGQVGRLKVTGPWDGMEETTEVVVRGLPDGVEKSELWRHFKQAGKIDEVTVEEAKLPPEFYLPAAPLPSGGFGR